jgi:hypothetical protein
MLLLGNCAITCVTPYKSPCSACTCSCYADSSTLRVHRSLVSLALMSCFLLVLGRWRQS